MTQIAGVDGCPKGWIAIVLKDGHFARAEFSPTFAELLSILADAQVIAVDIPIGLPDGSDPRAADVEARKLLGPRGSSVFATPPRVVLEAPSYAKANALSKERFGRGISAQSYALRKKILEVDACAANDDRIYEVHPEVCFTRDERRAPGLPEEILARPSRLRLRLLANAGITIPDDLGAWAQSLPMTSSTLLRLRGRQSGSRMAKQIVSAPRTRRQTKSFSRTNLVLAFGRGLQETTTREDPRALSSTSPRSLGHVRSRDCPHDVVRDLHLSVNQPIPEGDNLR